MVVGFRKPGVVKGTTYRELGTFPWWASYPQAIPWQRGRSSDWSDLKGERLVLLPPERTLPQAAKLQGALLEGNRRRRSTSATPGRPSRLWWAGGFGVAILPNLLVPPSGTVEAVPLVGGGAGLLRGVLPHPPGKTPGEGLHRRTAGGVRRPKDGRGGRPPEAPPCAPGDLGYNSPKPNQTERYPWITFTCPPPSRTC